jgi:lipoprotein-anchoring transpeptidase ErfK/SrfK
MGRRHHPVILKPRLAALAVPLMLAAAAAQAQEAENIELWPQRKIVVSIPERKLVLLENGRVIKIYDAAVGASKSPTPTGEFTITLQLQHPTWWGRKKVVAPGKLNPLGTRWIGISKRGYGIHGTNSPDSIGRAASRGCIRMRNEDVEELYEMVSAGDTVELRSDTLLAAGVPVEIAAER